MAGNLSANGVVLILFLGLIHLVTGLTLTYGREPIVCESVFRGDRSCIRWLDEEQGVPLPRPRPKSAPKDKKWESSGVRRRVPLNILKFLEKHN